MNYDFVESDRIERLEAEYTVGDSPADRRALATALAEEARHDFEHDTFGLAGKEMRRRLAELHEAAPEDTEVAANLAAALEAEIRYNFSRSPSTQAIPPGKQRERLAELLDLADAYRDDRIQSAVTGAFESVVTDYRLAELSDNRLDPSVEDLDETIDLFQRADAMGYWDVTDDALSEMESHRETVERRQRKHERRTKYLNRYTLLPLVLLPPVVAYTVVIMQLTGQAPFEIYANQLIYDVSPEYRAGQIAAGLVVAAEMLFLGAYAWYRQQSDLDRIRNQYN